MKRVVLLLQGQAEKNKLILTVLLIWTGEDGLQTRRIILLNSYK